ncbi:MAG: Lrp/AsnC ligand binding domain-containing protein [Acidimicrobiia bacterium]|jgi:DNA-binding Lrp family transcriptional regulator
MIEAYVLIQTEVGKAAQVVAAVKEIPGVTRAVVLTGPYDLLAHVEAIDVDSLGRLAVSEIQAVDSIVRTVTCPVVHL